MRLLDSVADQNPASALADPDSGLVKCPDRTKMLGASGFARVMKIDAEPISSRVVTPVATRAAGSGLFGLSAELSQTAVNRTSLPAGNRIGRLSS